MLFSKGFSNEKGLKSDIYRVGLNEPLYPKLLREIHDPPEHLFYHGNLDPSLFPIAIVGSRKMTPYGQSAITKIIKELSGLPVVIVSGLAYGVDAAAHKAALDNNIATIAVLGNSLFDHIYPKQNQPLAEEIINSGGTVISELEKNFSIRKMNFPMRNRIISGMSKCVVIIEADADSGSLITADYAIEHHRDIFALPGSIFSKYSQGTNNLIKDFAFPITCADDLILRYPELQLEVPKRKQKQLQLLSTKQQNLLNLIGYEGSHKRVIYEKSGMSLTEFNIAITELEINNFIKETSLNLYVKL